MYLCIFRKFTGTPYLLSLSDVKTEEFSCVSKLLPVWLNGQLLIYLPNWKELLSQNCDSLVPPLQIWDPRLPKSCTCRRWMARACCLSGTPQRITRWWPTTPSCTERPTWRTNSNRSSVPLNSSSSVLTNVYHEK